MSTLDYLMRSLKQLKTADKKHITAIEDRIVELSEVLRRRIDYHTAVAMRVDNWLPACNGTETPFRTRTGRLLLYCWNPAQNKHGYIDVMQDILLSDEEAQIALGNFGAR